jgi:hypothetical protein
VASEPLDLTELRNVDDDERPASPVTPPPGTRPTTPDSPEQERFQPEMVPGEGSGTGDGDVMQTLLQELINQRGIRTARVKVEDPELFYGERTKLRAFLVQCELKFNCESNKFVTHAEKVNYASARCRGAAWKWIEPSIVNGTSKYDTWADFKTAIQRAFGEIDAKEIAKVKFNKIEQGNRSAAVYWADFQNIIADLDYNDSAYIDRFDAGLPERTQTQMAMLPERPTTIVNYANKAIEIDNRLYNIRARHTKGNPRYGSGMAQPLHPVTERKETATLPDPEPMDLDATRRYRFAGRPGNRPTGANRTPLGPCYSCGKKGHMIRDCPTSKKPQYRRPYRAAEVTYEEYEETGAEAEPAEPEPQSGNGHPQEKA